MIRTVIFDLGRVIVPFDFTRGYSRMAERCGLTPEEVRTRIRAMNIVTPYETGLIESREFVRSILERIGADMPYEEFGEIWSSVFLPETSIPDSLVGGLKKNHRLVLLSNTNEIHFEMIRAKYPILRHFDEFVLSYEVKAMKPDPKIYHAAIEKAGCPAGECFFTDDVPEYVAGARAVGIDAVLFESADQIEKELSSRGIRW
jgi:FMN phosphatase YigB (HAD superfamily)